MVNVLINILNSSGTDVLYHTGDGVYKLLKAYENTQVLCTGCGVISLCVKHIYGSTICVPNFKYWYEKIAYYLFLKQERDYHAAVSSVYSFTGLKENSEIIITHITFNRDYNIYLDCFLATSMGSVLENMHHDITDYEYIKGTYKKKARNIMIWQITVGFIIDDGLITIGLLILLALLSLFNNANIFLYGFLLAGFFFLLALIPNVIDAVKDYRDDSFFYHMSSKYINSLILEQDNFMIGQ